MYQNKVMVSKMKVIVYFLPRSESLSQELLLSKCTETARGSRSVAPCCRAPLLCLRERQRRGPGARALVCDIASSGSEFLKRNKRRAAGQTWN